MPNVLTGGWLRGLSLTEKCGLDGIFPALLQEGWRGVVPFLIRIVCACLDTDYVPTIWLQVKVVFISKPYRNSCSGPRDFRPINLTSFLLKTMERLVDMFLEIKLWL